MDRRSVAVPEAWVVVTQALLVADREAFYTIVTVTSTLALVFAMQVGKEYQCCNYDASHRGKIDRMTDTIVGRICASSQSKLRE